MHRINSNVETEQDHHDVIDQNSINELEMNYKMKLEEERDKQHSAKIMAYFAEIDKISKRSLSSKANLLRVMTAKKDNGSNTSDHDLEKFSTVMNKVGDDQVLADKTKIMEKIEKEKLSYKELCEQEIIIPNYVKSDIRKQVAKNRESETAKIETEKLKRQAVEKENYIKSKFIEDFASEINRIRSSRYGSKQHRDLKVKILENLSLAVINNLGNASPAEIVSAFKQGNIAVLSMHRIGGLFGLFNPKKPASLVMIEAYEKEFSQFKR